MAKTVAERSSYLEILSSRFDAAVEEVAQLWSENERLRGQLHEASVESARHREEQGHHRKQLEEARLGWREQERVNNDLRQELALVRQRLDDHLKRVELWDTRRWGLIVSVALAVFGVAASFTSGLLLATLRK
ncbi:MAG: hypothetical protein U0871_27565 [Gemmataceae bacterium]